MLEIDYTLKIILGYVLSFGYSGLVVLVGELLHRKLHIVPSVTRKIAHLMSCVNWVIGYLFFGPCYHLVIMNAVSTVILIPLVLCNLFKCAQRDDAKSSYGIIWFAFSTCVVAALAVFVNKDWYILTGIPYYCMVFGDGLAPLTAKLANRSERAWNIKLFKEKTLVGLLTVLTVSIATVVTFNYVFGLGLGWLFMVSLGFLAALIEQYCLFGTDNLVLELLVFGYLILNYYGLARDALCVSFIVCVPFLILSALTKALSPSGYITSLIYFAVLSYCLGYVGLVTISALFLVEAIISKITTRKFNESAQNPQAKTARGGWQIICTGFGAIVGAALYCALGHPVFLMAALAAVATEFADSVSSDIGRLSRSAPVDILRFKKVPAGISGGVSLLGSIAGFVMALISCAVPLIFVRPKVYVYFILVAVAFAGVFFDSVLGSALQSLYRCRTCDILTEKTTHCNGATVKIKGLSFIDNSAVNLITGLVVCGATIGILWTMFI